MKITNRILTGYEDTKLMHYKDLPSTFPNTVNYEDLPNQEMRGVLKANRYVDGKLVQTYSELENHVGVIAATRLGKTSEYVIPTILSFAKQKTKKRMIISDPKGELYKTTAETLRQEGYNVKLFNFRDYQHSEYWNPLTPIYRLYQKAYSIEDEVGIVDTDHGVRNIFRGIIYESQEELDEAIDRAQSILMEEVGNEIDKIAMITISTVNGRDPYWEDSARILLTALIWAMLEDSHPEEGEEAITEEKFSFSTALTIMDSMRDGNGSNYNDDGFFTSRKATSKALALAKNCILENASTTRKCIISSFNTKMSIYKSSTIRLITSCNSFEMNELIDEEKPIAIFIAYKDELKAHYQVISSLVQNAYSYLIEHANQKPSGKLDVPFYFILDEFGNFPKIVDFETVVSACAGRNIWFILILQSYAQLNNVYGQHIAEIIRDNLNLHVFIGSNNPETLNEFSKECGQATRISPLCALNGNKEEIETYQIETIPLMPKSILAGLKVGECIVTEANCGYVLYSKLERYFQCAEFNQLPLADDKKYITAINPLDRKYAYVRKPKNNDWDF
ncbi:MAG: type IV secretory system conjugative DNA transfer family protein [Anaeroplasmataceae bacterium]|nr:type IV secretory system conjugative DNA transfer family protein [Anaeroplasmataceae bacterium]MDE6413988.1 type IV secretory system conjugative DNA transfer family protein [Anaeroplasmataceae bacterium]